MTRLLIPQFPDMKRPGVRWAMIAGGIFLLVTGLFVLLMVPAALLAAIHFAPNVVFKNFCRDVWLHEKGLLLQLKERQICIPFDLVEKITWHGSNNPPRAKIMLNAAGPYGSVFTFVPDLTEWRNRARKMVEELNAKLTS